MALTEKDKAALAAISRAALAAAVRGARYVPEDPDLPALREQRGCFVTLKLGGDLRGCIGCFTSAEPLYRTVAGYTRISALEDPRFAHNRIHAIDLPDVAIDISCLTPLVPCPDPAAITLGVHGIHVRGANGASGCYLPQVATETGWSVEEFWSSCCRDKAGLPPGAWKHPGTTCMTFTADVFDA